MTDDVSEDRSLSQELLDDPNSFGFFQAVHLLQRLNPSRTPVGRFGDPRDEAVRFGANPALAFPASEIDDLQAADDAPWKMTVNFLGLVGHSGVLPRHYSVLVMQRLRERDRALLDFLDIFHHRLISLFYRAWERSHSYAPLERGEEDRITLHLFDLLGLGEPGSRRGLGLEEDVLLGYVGLLGPQQRSALALEQLIEDYFGLPAVVEQFVGGWYDVSSTAQCRVDDASSDDFSRLGFGTLLGDEVWDSQARARIVLGPLTQDQFVRFIPSGDGFKELCSITRFFSDDRIEFELKLLLERDDVPPLALGTDQTEPLGWGTWLRSAPFSGETAETVLTLEERSI